MIIISQKQTLATVNLLKVVKNVLSKTLKLYRAPAPLPTLGMHPLSNLNSLKTKKNMKTDKTKSKTKKNTNTKI